MTREAPSSEMKYRKKFTDVLGKSMAYVETGEGAPIVFLHENPVHSYAWRNVIPHLEHLGRCIAPDLIGMGDSEKLEPTTKNGRDGRYRFVEHRRYLDRLLEILGVTEDVTLVLHGWGAALGFDWANRHRGRVKCIAYTDARVRAPVWSEITLTRRLLFRALRMPWLSELLVMRFNIFVNIMMPAATQRKLTKAEMAAYRQPYLKPGEDRRVILTWAWELPFDGKPADVDEIIRSYGEWLVQSDDLPKLFLNAEPGGGQVGKAREFARSWPNQKEVTVPGRHYIQEDCPSELGRAIAEWLKDLA